MPYIIKEIPEYNSQSQISGVSSVLPPLFQFLMPPQNARALKRYGPYLAAAAAGLVGLMWLYQRQQKKQKPSHGEQGDVNASLDEADTCDMTIPQSSTERDLAKSKVVAVECPGIQLESDHASLNDDALMSPMSSVFTDSPIDEGYISLHTDHMHTLLQSTISKDFVEERSVPDILTENKFDLTGFQHCNEEGTAEDIPDNSFPHCNDEGAAEDITDNSFPHCNDERAVEDITDNSLISAIADNMLRLHYGDTKEMQYTHLDHSAVQSAVDQEVATEEIQGDCDEVLSEGEEASTSHSTSASNDDAQATQILCHGDLVTGAKNPNFSSQSSSSISVKSNDDIQLASIDKQIITGVIKNGMVKEEEVLDPNVSLDNSSLISIPIDTVSSVFKDDKLDTRSCNRLTNTASTCSLSDNINSTSKSSTNDEGSRDDLVFVDLKRECEAFTQSEKNKTQQSNALADITTKVHLNFSAFEGILSRMQDVQNTYRSLLDSVIEKQNEPYIVPCDISPLGHEYCGFMMSLPGVCVMEEEGSMLYYNRHDHRSFSLMINRDAKQKLPDIPLSRSENGYTFKTKFLTTFRNRLHLALGMSFGMSAFQLDTMSSPSVKLHFCNNVGCYEEIESAVWPDSHCSALLELIFNIVSRQALPNNEKTIEVTPCLQASWPSGVLSSWLHRPHRCWPPKDTVEEIAKLPCHLVPSEQGSKLPLLWHFSFIKATNHLLTKFCCSQLTNCLLLLKHIVKHLQLACITAQHIDVLVLHQRESMTEEDVMNHSQWDLMALLYTRLISCLESGALYDFFLVDQNLFKYLSKGDLTECVCVLKTFLQDGFRNIQRVDEFALHS